jgi:hypothetical protein
MLNMVCLSFVPIVLLFRVHAAVAGKIVWGMLLLSGLNYILARHPNVGATSELAKHLAVAMVVYVCERTQLPLNHCTCTLNSD